MAASLLTPGQSVFAVELARLTGLNANVIRAWELAEESGGSAAARQHAGNHNWLNIAYYDSGAGSGHAHPDFKNPVSGARRTSLFLHGRWLGADPSIQAILKSRNQTPSKQIDAIWRSKWASSHYGNGASLRATYSLVTHRPADVSGGGSAGSVDKTPTPSPDPADSFDYKGKDLKLKYKDGDTISCEDIARFAVGPAGILACKLGLYIYKEGKGGAQAVLDGPRAIASLIAALLNPSVWLRILQVIGGILVSAAGVILIIRTEAIPSLK